MSAYENLQLKPPKGHQLHKKQICFLVYHKKQTLVSSIISYKQTQLLFLQRKSFLFKQSTFSFVRIEQIFLLTSYTTFQMYIMTQRRYV